MDKRREEGRNSIRYRVWSGYYDAGEVFDSILDDVWFDSTSDDDGWLRAEIQREFQKKRADERSWPPVTNCDRLDQVFAALRSRAILSRHRCGLTIQDGLHVIDGLYEEEGGKRSGLAGYCFYHLQDMEGAMWGERGLWLAFGSFSENSADGVEVGRHIRSEFQRAGFEVDWDESVKSRLLLKRFRWQRRSPEAEAGTAADDGHEAGS
jgi:hypothetical protein